MLYHMRCYQCGDADVCLAVLLFVLFFFALQLGLHNWFSPSVIVVVCHKKIFFKKTNFVMGDLEPVIISKQG